MLAGSFLLFCTSNAINEWDSFFWIPCSFSLIFFLFTVHFCMHWMILLFTSKELLKGNGALDSFIANLIMFCIVSNSTDTSDQKLQ